MGHALQGSRSRKFKSRGPWDEDPSGKHGGGEPQFPRWCVPTKNDYLFFSIFKHLEIKFCCFDERLGPDWVGLSKGDLNNRFKKSVMNKKGFCIVFDPQHRFVSRRPFQMKKPNYIKRHHQNCLETFKLNRNGPRKLGIPLLAVRRSPILSWPLPHWVMHVFMPWLCKHIRSAWTLCFSFH